DHAAYEARGAVTTEGGLHVAAIRRNVASYQHIDPALVGNEVRVVVSELSGRGNLMSKAEEFGLSIEHHEQIAGVLQEIKELEARGFSFEAAEASVALMLRRQVEGYEPPFELVDYTVFVEHRDGRGMVTEATVKVAVGGEVDMSGAAGNGQGNALRSDQ